MPKERITSTGTGESRIFSAPADDPMRVEPPVRTVNGVPIPPEFAHAIPYDHTDQGIAERAAQPKAWSSGFSDSFDKLIAERRESLMEGTPTWAAPNPMKELADAHIGPGMSPRFLSPSKCDREGTRGFQVVRNEKGDPVKLGNMVLAQIPEELAQKRRQHYQDQGRQAQAKVIDEYQEQSAQLARVVTGRPAGRTHHPDGDEGLQSVTGNEHF